MIRCYGDKIRKVLKHPLSVHAHTHTHTHLLLLLFCSHPCPLHTTLLMLFSVCPHSAFPSPAVQKQPLPAPQQLPLISLMGTVVPQPPPLTGNVDPTKIEEIRRTVYVGNLNSNVCCLPVFVFFCFVFFFVGGGGGGVGLG